jgi:hypothetical protein
VLFIKVSANAFVLRRGSSILLWACVGLACLDAIQVVISVVVIMTSVMVMSVMATVMVTATVVISVIVVMIVMMVRVMVMSVTMVRLAGLILDFLPQPPPTTPPRGYSPPLLSSIFWMISITEARRHCRGKYFGVCWSGRACSGIRHQRLTTTSTDL